MDYPKDLRKAAMGKRVIMIVCIASFLGLAVGGASGYALRSYMIIKEMEKEQIER